jgi:hypothetical protein
VHNSIFKFNLRYGINRFGLSSKQLILSVCSFGILLMSYAQDNTPKYSNEFLSLGVGAKAFAMGGAQSAIVSDVSASYWNPAGLLQVESNQQLMLMHAVYFDGIANYDFGAMAFSLPDSSRLAFSLIRFSIDDIPDTRYLFDANGAINYDNISFFAASDYAGWISYAKRLERLGGVDLGANIKVIHRLVGSFSQAWGFGLDLGAQKKIRRWGLGLTARDVFGTFNAWSHNPEEFRDVFQQTGNDVPVNSIEITLPTWVLGVSRVFPLTSAFDLLVTADFRTTFDGKRNALFRTNLVSVEPVVGMEVAYKQQFLLRLGTGQFQQVEQLDGSLNWNTMFGGGLGVRLSDFTLDYALTDFSINEVGLYTHVFSVKIDFHEKAN